MADRITPSPTRTTFADTEVDAAVVNHQPPPAPPNHLDLDQASTGANAFEGPIARLGSHESYEVALRGGIAVGGLGAKGEAKLKVSLRDDGRYDVEAVGAGAAGLGADHLKGMLGGGTTVRYVAQTASEAARLADALAKVELFTGAKLSLGALAPLTEVYDAATGTTATARQTIRQSTLGEVRCDLRGLAETNTPRAPAGLTGETKGELSRGRSLSVNLETGMAVISERADLKAEGELHLDLGPGGGVMEHLSDRFGGKVEGKLSFREETRAVLPESLKRRIATANPSELAHLAPELLRLPAETVVVAEVEIEAKAQSLSTEGLKATLTAEFPVKRGSSPTLPSALVDASWNVELEAGLGAEKKLDAEVVSAECSAMVWHSSHFKAPSLRQALSRVADSLTAQRSMQSSIETSRLRARITE